LRQVSESESLSYGALIAPGCFALVFIAVAKSVIRTGCISLRVAPKTAYGFIRVVLATDVVENAVRQ
jgi:hypothetical protein